MSFRPARVLALLGAVALVAGSAAASVGSTAASASAFSWPVWPGFYDWPSYGHDAQHTFHGRTLLNPHTATTLRQAWFFPTGDAVTATPTVVGGTVYVGSWDGYFYAIDLETGRLRWKYQLDPQPSITPFPGETPRDTGSDGGLVTSSAWYQPGWGDRPDLVIFGAGFTLYALDARTGALYWSHEYTGRPDLPPDPATDGTRIFSSPVVSDGKVLFGVDVDGAGGYRGYIAAASLRTGAPVWEFQTDVGPDGALLNNGCGDVWSSGTLLPREGAVVFGTADCHSSNQASYSEAMLAFRVKDGRLLWMFKPSRVDPGCDTDFGATANAGVTGWGSSSFLGEGAKDGTYYSVDPDTGQLRWSTNVVFGGSSGGFIGSTAYDGQRVYGSTALGEFPGPVCEPDNPADTLLQEPTAHSFDAANGSIEWQQDQQASFSPTTVAGGLLFSGAALASEVQITLASTGELITQLPLSAPCWSGIATVGNAIVLGTGSSFTGDPDGVVAFTPAGRPPNVPRRPLWPS